MRYDTSFDNLAVFGGPHNWNGFPERTNFIESIALFCLVLRAHVFVTVFNILNAHNTTKPFVTWQLVHWQNPLPFSSDAVECDLMQWWESKPMKGLRFG
jgi:hypothetical protein